MALSSATFVGEDLDFDGCGKRDDCEAEIPPSLSLCPSPLGVDRSSEAVDMMAALQTGLPGAIYCTTTTRARVLS